MSDHDNEKEKAAEAEKKEVTFESMLEGLPIPDKHKQALMNLVSNMVSSIAQTNERLAAIEAKAGEFNANKYEGTGLSAEQIYSIEMAKANAPAAAAQQQLIRAVIGGRVGGGGDSGLGGLVKNAEALNSLRSYLLPPATAQQIALEQAQIDQIKAQTRLMNRVTGKKVEEFIEGKGEEE